MNDELRAVLTEALEDELTGWTIGDGYYKSQVPFHEAREMADTLVGILLSLPGVAVIQLPEPDDDHGDGIAFWTAQEVGVADGMVVARFDPGNEAIYYEPSEAWKVTSALAAAAAAAMATGEEA
ncbi:hypothetical protein SEA_AJAY_76 [Mycobacterium phage Ajay]|uniref:Uncharacterized protein n=1 Tax=Mycobacterium phage KSSJEB TaxID=2922216 RepID=G1D722_9CAUD|nr:hypothetical protein FGG25_gp78 [Mycobacterium phage KSSJEB]AEK10570.1 hypothetical protein PBI_KSSJEB_78 [Mycobacterium phage KSSJEB]QDP44811.1 hypothetical protein SEA_AJAY_76 [Mycobacterium phage Ajay]UJD21274.1 hypothetical protein SEA_EYEBALL_79 [Mycobacterium phage Eyeball]